MAILQHAKEATDVKHAREMIALKRELDDQKGVNASLNASKELKVRTISSEMKA